MTLEQLQELIGDPEKLRDTLSKEKGSDKSKDYLEQYEPATHAITKRADKTIETEKGPSVVTTSKLTLSFQKKIVFFAAAFLVGNPIKIGASPADITQEELLEVINKTLDDNKLQYKNFQLAEHLFSETECAELWYTEQLSADDDYWLGTPNEKVQHRLRMKILAPSLGDGLLPSFNEYGDMIAFGRQYFIQVGDEKQEHLDVYTPDWIYQYVKTSAGWSETKTANAAKKIPVIYYRQAKPEWSDVQTLIDRAETSHSRHADTNDYFGAPMVKVVGQVKGFSSKGEDGKVLELDPGAEADYMSWDNSPESVKLEQENLRSYIFDNTDTPDISFTQMSKLGTFSGFAIKLLFMNAHLKAAKKEQIFGEGVQRRLNFIKATMIRLNPTLEKARQLKLNPEFEYYLPKDTEGEVEVLSRAVESKILSKRSAITKNPLVENVEEELKRIEEEKNDPKGLDDLNNEE